MIYYMKFRTSHLFIAVAIVSVIGAMTMFFTKIRTITETDKVILPSIDDVPAESWAKLADRKIFFGHKSVGYNIIDGIADVMNEHDYIKLNVVVGQEPTTFDLPVLAHSHVGMNTDPVSKIRSFMNIMDNGMGSKVDIAFFKFCYVDIMRDSDPQEIFNCYRAAFEELKNRYPDTKFLHITVPICSVPKGVKRNLKQSVKLLIGMPGVLDDNMMRKRYNKLLRDAYSKTEPFFDLALIESVNPDGFRCYAAKGTEKVNVMASEYTEDGGHLNIRGRRKVAEQLLIILAQMTNRS